MAAVDSAGPVVFPLLPRLSTLRATSRPPSSNVRSFSKHHKNPPPPPTILFCMDHERGVCIGTHMSRIPTVFPLEREKKKKREREAYTAVTLWERSRERTKEVRAFLCLRNAHTHTRAYARVRVTGNDRRHVHSRARPFAALSWGPPFKTARAMDRRIGALFLFATHAWAI